MLAYDGFTTGGIALEKLISKILLLCALVGTCFGAYAYVTEKPSSLIGEQKKELEAQIEKVETSIRTEMKERREARDREMSGLKEMITGAEHRLLEKLDKIDDRLYELQRRQGFDASRAIDDNGGG